MHKDNPVLEFSMDASGHVFEIGQVYSVGDLPTGTTPDKDSLQKWWMERTVSANREGIIELKQISKLSDEATPSINIAPCRKQPTGNVSSLRVLLSTFLLMRKVGLGDILLP